MYDATIEDRTKKPLQITEKDINRITQSFSERMVSINQAIRILRDNDIRINNDEAIIILDFLYMLAASFKKDTNLELRD